MIGPKRCSSITKWRPPCSSPSFRLNWIYGKGGRSLVSWPLPCDVCDPTGAGGPRNGCSDPWPTMNCSICELTCGGSQESGIYFLAEWIPNRLSCWLGPLIYGLPYRLGALDYQHEHESAKLGGRVQVEGASFAYEAEFGTAEPCKPAGPGSLGEFALERYTAFTGKGRTRRCFHIAHAAWPQREVSVKVTDDSLLRQGQPWFAGARFAGAHYSPGVNEVWMSRPHWLGGLRV